MPTPLTQRILKKIQSATGWKLSEPDYCPQVVSKLKAYQQQHQNLQTIFNDLLSQAPYLPDVKWDEPFMSSPYYKDITNAPKDIFDNLYDAKEEARKKLEELKKYVYELLILQIEKIISIKEQYKSQVEVLTQSNILEQLSNGEMGIRGVDGKEYPLPTYQEVLGRFKDQEKRTLLEKKVKQGFTKLLLVPFAMPLSVLLERHKEVLLKTYKESGIKSTDGTRLELNINDPLFVWEDLVQGDNPDTDKSQQIEYGVKTYDADTKESRGGKYKSELLKDPDNAWQILLLENSPDLPAENKGKTISGRKQIEAGQTPKYYLKLLQTQEQYQGETGLTPEANLTLYLDGLTRNRIALDDFRGKGRCNWLVGNYLSGSVPYFRWDCDSISQTYLSGENPDYYHDFVGFRPSVRF